jgi:hypothetical protein
MDDILKEIYKKYDTKNLLQEYSKKNNTSPVLYRTEFNQHVKCQIDKCAKISVFLNLNDNTNICWFHAYTLND